MPLLAVLNFPRVPASASSRQATSFQQASDFFFEKISLKEAPLVIPGAMLDSTCQVAFDACSGLVEAELDSLVRRTQGNKDSH